MFKKEYFNGMVTFFSEKFFYLKKCLYICNVKPIKPEIMTQFKYTSAETTNYKNALINAIKIFMEDNHLTEVSLKGTDFYTKGEWKSLVIEDGELKILRRANESLNKEWTETFMYISLYDIVNVQKEVMKKIYSLY